MSTIDHMDEDYEPPPDELHQWDDEPEDDDQLDGDTCRLCSGKRCLECMLCHACYWYTVLTWGCPTQPAISDERVLVSDGL